MGSRKNGADEPLSRAQKEMQMQRMDMQTEKRGQIRLGVTSTLPCVKLKKGHLQSTGSPAQGSVMT